MAATAAVEILLGKLSEHAFEEVTLLLSVDDEIEPLKGTLEMIQSFLEDADKKLRDKNNQLVRKWVRQIQELAYDIEDVLEEYSLRQGHSRWRGRLKRIASFPYRILARHRLAKRMQRNNKKLQQISNCASQLGIQGLPSSSASSSYSTDTTLIRRYEPEEDVVGFHEDVELITRQLCDPSETPRRVVISIVGMGGLGKTTIANKVYQSKAVKDRFQCRAWIFVSQTYVVKELLSSIIKQVLRLDNNEIKDMSEPEMKNKLRKHFRERRYLVVLDDIWEVSAWNAIRAAFPEGSTGSRVLLTTRRLDVANVADVPPHEPNILSAEESWNLFCKKAFITASCPPHLQRLSEQIIQICGGLPLAIVVVGGVLLRREQSTKEWMRVVEQISYEFKEGEDGTQRILGLSYDDLPRQLKPCFLCFAAFPEDRPIEADRLIRLWIAEGFIRPKQGQTMEDLAEIYLIDLIDRSMIQLASKDPIENVCEVRIHDLLLDLARSEAAEINFYWTNSDMGDPTSLRRISITEDRGFHQYMSLNCSTPKLRSLLFHLQDADSLPKFTFHGCKFLRVLDLSNLKVERLPEEMGELILLRYINLSFSGVKELPSSIGNLCHLQTLDIMGSNIHSVPDSFWNIQTLRHVLLEGDYPIKPTATCCLEDMHTLSWVQCGDWVRDGGCLEKMTNLRSLSMKGIKSSDDEALVNALEKLTRLVRLGLGGEALPAKLLTSSHHPHLQGLELWGPLVRHQPKHMDVDTSQFLPPNLMYLGLEGSMLENDDELSILGTLPNLVNLELRDDAFVGSVMVFSKGGFPRLQKLALKNLSNLQEWRVEEGAMPCLRELYIRGCNNMRMLPEGLRGLTQLDTLELHGMEVIERRIEKDIGEDYHKIQHVPSIEID